MDKLENSLSMEQELNHRIFSDLLLPRYFLFLWLKKDTSPSRAIS